MSDATRLNKNSTKACPLVWAEERSVLVRVRGMVGWGRGDREERADEEGRCDWMRGEARAREAAFCVVLC